MQKQIACTMSLSRPTTGFTFHRLLPSQNIAQVATSAFTDQVCWLRRVHRCKATRRARGFNNNGQVAATVVSAEWHVHYAPNLKRKDRTQCSAKRSKAGSALDVESKDSNAQPRVSGASLHSPHHVDHATHACCSSDKKKLPPESASCHTVGVHAADPASTKASTAGLPRSQSTTAAPSAAEPEQAVHTTSTRPSDEDLLQEWQEVCADDGQNICPSSMLQHDPVTPSSLCIGCCLLSTVHVSYMPNDRLHKKLLFGEVKGLRRPGRPRSSCNDIALRDRQI